MKVLKLITGLFVLVCLLVACKTVEVNTVKKSTITERAYNYVDIDPLVIGTTWGEPVAMVPLNQFVVEMYFRNPDKDHDIQFATLLVMPAGIAAYSYIIDSKINFCEFNPETNAYESTWEGLSEENKQLWSNDYKTYFDLGGV